MNAQLWKSLGDFVRLLLPAPPTLAVRATVPDVDDELLATTRLAVQQTFRQVAHELGIERDVDVTMIRRPDGADTVEVSADDRPVAIFAAPRAPDWSATVCAQMHLALLRRARVLLDDATVDKVGRKLSSPSPADVRRTLEHLLDNGIGIRHLDGRATWNEGRSPAETAELLINDLASPNLELTLAESSLRNTPNDERACVRDLRLRLFNEHGIRFPDLAIASHDIQAGEMRVRLNDLTTPTLPLAAPATLPEILAALDPIIANHAAWFVRADDAEAQRAELASEIPDLVHAAEAQIPSWLLSACLRALISNSDSVRNLPRIIWLLLESDPPRDGIDEITLSKSAANPVSENTPIAFEPEFLPSTIRRLIAYEAWAGGETPSNKPLVSLPIEWEDNLIHASSSRAIAKTEWLIVRTLFASPNPPLIVTHTVAGTTPTRQVLRALPHPPRVIASQELPPDAPLPEIHPLANSS
jgi:hypothetical protein